MNKPTSFWSIASTYPELSASNQQDLDSLLGQLSKSPHLGGGELSNIDWPIISQNGTSNGMCGRNILSLAGDKSNFYKQRWKNVYNLEQACVYLLDYYECCKHITKLGVLLTDVWRPSTLSRWGHIFEMYEAMGIQSVAILYSGNQITPIRWPWR